MELQRREQPRGQRRRKPATPLGERLHDEARFLRSWLDNPLSAGAITPSSPALARAMAAAVDPERPGPVVELGPGTGPVTEALLERGIAEDRLILVEFDADFCTLLRARFPRAPRRPGRRLCAGEDARRPSHPARFRRSCPACRCSRGRSRRGSPFCSRRLRCSPRARRSSSSPTGCPRPCPRQGGGFNAEVSPPIWLNLPPARVWVYRADPAARGRGRTGSHRPPQGAGGPLSRGVA